MAKIVWGADLYKGTTLKNNPGMMRLADFAPYQMLEEAEKTKDWIIAVTDHYEAIGWRNVEKKADRLQKNYWLRQGILNPSDYLINPTQPYVEQAMRIMGEDGHSNSPLQQFYPIIPVYVDLLRGEFIKRDNTFSVSQIDQGAVVEALQYKEDSIQEVLMNLAIAEKQKTLAQMGIASDPNNPESQQQYQQAIQETISTFNRTEAEFKKFRTVGAKWAQKVVKIQENRYNLAEIEPDAFECGLITDSCFWHLDLLEDDFKLELLNPKFVDWHKGPNIKYVSDGDYFHWFDFGSAGDIINKYGKMMKESDIEKLKTTYASILNSIVVPDHEKTMQGAYYDVRVPYKQASDLNPAMNDAILGKELAYNFSQNPNFEHSIFDPAGYNTLRGEPKMFRVYRLYFRGMKKIGWLTKIGEDGAIEYADWVDENFKVTVEPKYDFSLTKEKTPANLLYGEHIDWTWVNDWRHVIKISADTRHTFWKNNPDFKEIYLDGAPVKFQFKGINNPFESKPPVEGCEYSWINARPYGFVDRLKSTQVLYNIAMNKVPKAFVGDKMLKVAINQGIIPRNSADLEAGISPLESFEQSLNESDILPYHVTREHLDTGMGQPATPQVINLSTAEIAQFYLNIGQQIKIISGEIVGITQNRIGAGRPSQTAYGAEQNVTYSESQTEKYFENHYNLMKRVRQRMLDAAQFYTTFKEKSREVYLNEREETDLLEIEGLKNLLPHYQINLESTAKNRSLLNMLTQFLVQENTLPFKPAEKVKALVSNSIPQIIELFEKTEIEAAIQAEEERRFEMEEAEKNRQNLLAIEQAKLAAAERHDDKMIEKDLEVAKIRALGGLQSDNNLDGTVDARENLDAYFKDAKLRNDQDVKEKQLAQKEREHIDNVDIQNRQIDAKIAGDKGKIAVALANQQARDDKKLNRQIAKKNKIT